MAAEGFLDKILALFGGEKNDESGKKKQLKRLARELSGNKYARFYRPKTEEIEGALGKFFYDVYRIISPAQVFLQNAGKSAQLKQVCAEAFLDKNLEEAKNRIGAEAIEERARTVQIKDLARQVKEDMAVLSAAFDNDRIGAIDRCYSLIMAMTGFVAFDFFFLLKKFDPNITERSFSYAPKFTPVRGEYLTDELKDFLEVSSAVDPGEDWKNVLRVLKIYKNGVDVAAPDQWTKLLVYLRDIRKSGILELMIRHIDKNPAWVSGAQLPDEHIAEAWLEGRQAEARGAIDKIVNAKKNAQVGVLATTIFGSADIERTKYYTVKNSEIYEKKNFDGFLFAQGINYLKAFLLDHFKKDIRELCDIFLIRGQWTAQALSQQMSDGFHRTMELSDKLIAFDETLSDDGENGSRLKASIIKADRDKSQARYVTIILNSVNEAARELINLAAQSLIIVGKNLKGLLEDYQKNPHELIINWKELEGASEIPLGQRIADTYKKIYYFIQIMQLLSKPAEE
ncbi:MAG: DUF5312 domain-containing protein [Treponema sp.]|jgi:hypothetical protein|nr:DUF5312 domain-containing protein [Treponema sp.]